MKVLFRENVKNVAHTGEIRDVAEAYARNFLLPKGLAVVATPSIIAEAERRAAHIAAEAKAKSIALAGARGRLEAVTVRLHGSASPSGKLFAAIKATQVMKELERQFSVELDGVECRPDHFKQAGPQSAQLVWPDRSISTLTVVIDHD